MKFERLLQGRLETLHQEGRYRVFADLRRRRGSFPVADHFAERVHGGHGVVLERLSRHGPASLGHSRHARGDRRRGRRLWRHAQYLRHDALPRRTRTRARGPARQRSRASVHLGIHRQRRDALHLVKLVPGTVVFSDEKNHASMIEGIRHGQATSTSFATTTSPTSRRN